MLVPSMVGEVLRDVRASDSELDYVRVINFRIIIIIIILNPR